MVTKQIVDSPLPKRFYMKYLSEVLWLPPGKAVELGGLRLKDAIRVQVAARRLYKFSTEKKSDGKGTFKVTIYRKDINESI